MEQNIKLNIALVIDSFYPSIDGVIKVVESYIKGLSKKCNITLITSKPQNDSDIKKYYSKLPCKTLFCASTKFKVQGYTVAKPTIDFDFKNKLNNTHFDLIHIHSLFPLGTFMFRFAKSNNIPVITTVHSQLKPDIKRYAKSDFITNLIFKNYISVFNEMDAVFSLNKKMDTYIKENGFTGTSYIMPNATNFKCNLDLKESSKQGRSLLKCNKKDNIFIFVGRLIEGKGILFILDALKIIKKNNINFKMFYVGSGLDENKLKNKIKEYEMEDCVKILGLIEDTLTLEKIYSASTLLLFPSIYDTDGLVKREAAACNLPSVLLNDTFAASEIENGYNGFTSAQTAKKYANTIINAIKNKKELNKVGECANKTLYFSWNKNLNKVYKCYVDIINKKRNLKTKKII